MNVYLLSPLDSWSVLYVSFLSASILSEIVPLYTMKADIYKNNYGSLYIKGWHTKVQK